MKYSDRTMMDILEVPSPIHENYVSRVLSIDGEEVLEVEDMTATLTEYFAQPPKKASIEEGASQLRTLSLQIIPCRK